jgi:hypothetical protein
MEPNEFIARWRSSKLTERSAAQSHFNDLCELLGVQKPTDADSTGETYTFEKSTPRTGAGSGHADVWKKDCFAWEYKGKHKNLVQAHAQLKQYADGLGNPPLLIVSDMEKIEIHTNFNSEVAQVVEFDIADLYAPNKRRELKDAWINPEAFRPTKTRKEATEDAAAALGKLANRLREQAKLDPERVAHFLNRLVFCMFAEDIGLLPSMVFADTIEEAVNEPAAFEPMLRSLFSVMRDKGGHFGAVRIPWVNGGLFDDDDVIPLGPLDVRELKQICRLDWGHIDPSIFGTLFEKGLDPEKRQQMASFFAATVNGEKLAAKPSRRRSPIAEKGVGIHYTDPEKIMLILEPVVLAPLRAEWAVVKERLAALQTKIDATKAQAQRTKAVEERRAVYAEFRKRLGKVTVLDPACGSGNFLYLALKHLKDLDLAIANEAVALGLPPDNQVVGPQAVRGIEVNPYAAELARVTVWIGELQWQESNGFNIKRRPVLGELNAIECRDALIDGDKEARWPEAEFIVGNPPFLGGKRMNSQLSESYVQRLFEVYRGRVPAEADLVCYWFEKARAQIEAGELKAAGLVATQSIRKGASRAVLDHIGEVGAIFNAWSDEPWSQEGAAVRVSLVCFAAKALSNRRYLHGEPVLEIYTDLTGKTAEASADVTRAKRLLENANISFMGDTKGGEFDVAGVIARKWLLLPTNVNGRPNADVLRPWANGMDVTRRSSDRWIVDFGWTLTEQQAAQYEEPFAHVKAKVLPERLKNRRDAYREYWWRHVEPRPGLRKALTGLRRYIATSRVSKHRLFAWFDAGIIPDSRIYAFARDDDTTFGILHSHIHEVWALRIASRHGVGNDPTYNNVTCFETFPFPQGLTPNIPAAAYAADPRAKAIAAAAKRLNELRENWLNPPDQVMRVPEVVPGFPDRVLPKSPRAEDILKKRTLTNLYNERPDWLVNVHRALDEAVAKAYGWPTALTDDEILSRLLVLNHERAAGGR